MSNPESLPTPDPASTAGAVAPRLGPAVAADLEALRNDVEQAREMACEYQRMLAGKSNDLATLRALFEKTSEDLLHLQAGVAQLREERHRLANEAMRATGLQFVLDRTAKERDALRRELESVQQAREAERARLTRLELENEDLLAEVERHRAAPAGSTVRDRAAQPSAQEIIALEWNEATPNVVAIQPAEASALNAARKARWMR